MLKFRSAAVLTCSVVLGLAADAVRADVVPYVETFTADHANWGTGGDWQTFEPLAWTAPGGSGPDGAGFVTATENFKDFSPGGFPFVLFRGQDNYGSSNDAFVGDWIGSSVMEFSFWVRHDAPTELQYFVRFTPAGANSPSMNFEWADDPVQADTWTKLTVTISPDNPGFVVGGGPGTYENVFGNLGKIQLGVEASPLAGIDEEFSFDLSRVAIAVPAPSGIAVLLLAGLGRTRRRRFGASD